MIAKVDRSTRRRATTRSQRSRAALRETVLLGMMTNTDFLERVLAHPAFAAGDTHTGFLDEHADALLAPPCPPRTTSALLLAAAALAARASTIASRSPSRSRRWAQWRP